MEYPNHLIGLHEKQREQRSKLSKQGEENFVFAASKRILMILFGT